MESVSEPAQEKSQPQEEEVILNTYFQLRNPLSQQSVLHPHV